jgi:hypothetical protein
MTTNQFAQFVGQINPANAENGAIGKKNAHDQENKQQSER